MSPMRRVWPVYALLLVLLSLLAGFAWLTRNPGSELAVRAEQWPLAGALVARLRRLYVPEQSPAERDGRSGQPAAGSAAAGDDAGASAPPAEPARMLWLAPGQTLRARPDAGAAAVGETDGYVQALVTGRSGRWRRVRLGAAEGWVLPPERAPGEPPLGSEPLPPRPLPASPAEPGRLAAAQRLLGDHAAAGRLGPYALLTDIADRELLGYFDRVASEVEPAYRRRYGLEPIGEPAETVVLFRHQAGYRVFQAREVRLRHLPAGGHAGYGLVALFTGERRREDTAGTLVHELVHLLNRRALGPALPPWLDEGLADDMADGAIAADGALDPARHGGAVERHRVRPGEILIGYHGAVATLRRLAQAERAGELPSLARVTALDWQEFVVSPERELNYAVSGHWVRYLLDQPNSELGAGFRGFLAAVAAGGPAAGEALRARLGRDWETLQAGFAGWVRAMAAARLSYPPAQEPGRAGESGEAGAASVSGSSSRHSAPPPA